MKRDRNFYKEWMLEEEKKIMADTHLDSEQKMELLVGLAAKIGTAFVLDICWDDDIYYETDLLTAAEKFAEHTMVHRCVIELYMEEEMEMRKNNIQRIKWTENKKREWIQEYGMELDEDVAFVYYNENSSILGTKKEDGTLWIQGAGYDNEVLTTNELITAIINGL